MGVDPRGKAMVESIRQGLARIDERVKTDQAHFGGARPRVILQLGHDPLVVAGGGSFLNDVLERVGAVNVYGQSPNHYPRPALEDAVHKNPDVIVVTGMADDSGETAGEVSAWNAFKNLKAVQDHKVVTVNADLLLRPTPRLLEGLSLLERAIYGGMK
jgi:iron complex transport system substrate-binding protein